MWYLIVPPLVFLGSLWLLLLFLSRRTTDPTVQERLALDTAPHRHLFFFKEDTGLRLLEKTTQRFKVLSLKLHNASHDLSQSLRKRREKALERSRLKKESESMTPLAPRKALWARFQSEAEGGQASFETEQSERVNTGGESEEAVTVVKTGETRGLFSLAKAGAERLRPGKNSGDSIARGENSHSFERRRETAAKVRRLVSEEDLIGKIAKNPKDAVAYEELGDYYMETSQLEDAKACYRQVIKLLPLNREVKEKVRKLERLLTHKGR